MGASAHRSTVRRFAAKEIEPERTVPLAPDHPALSEGRTIFMKTVTPSVASPRFLISGHSNTKLGKTVLKGPLAGAAIYQLSLEERATCPRSCQQWASCYGNSMPFARRHTPDAEFERLLIAEVMTLCRTHPDGLLIRLHVLGDFYSVEYVYIWASLLKQFPQLHVFGYTSRRTDDPDPETVRIARAIRVLTEGAWSRFAIRTSGHDNPERSWAIVVDEDPCQPDVIVCPAQTKATEACASCGLCWAEGVRDKTIAFLRHGRKLRGPVVPVPANDEAPTPVAPVKRIEKSAGPQMTDRILALLTGPEVSLTAKEIMEATGAPYTEVSRTCAMLDHIGKVSWAYARRPGARALKELRLAGLGTPSESLSENQAKLLDAMMALAADQADGETDGIFGASLAELVERSGIARGSICVVIEALIKKGHVVRLEAGRGPVPTSFQLSASNRPSRTLLAVPSPPPAPPVCPVIPIRTKITRPAAAPSADDLAPSSMVAAPRSLNARKPGQCAYPTNSPAAGRGEETEYCCAPVSGKLSYCADHARTMFAPRRAKA